MVIPNTEMSKMNCEKLCVHFKLFRGRNVSIVNEPCSVTHFFFPGAYFINQIQTSEYLPCRYTRNLVDEGNGKFNLMILCWGEGHGSSIHDHTDSHCFLKMLQGNLKETLFAWPDKKSNEMIKKSERILRENQCAYINDSIGLHRVENISHTEPAVSLHLYSPPFDTCHAFDQRTGHKNKVTMTFHSKFGIRIPFTASGSLENN
uniref:Cysteine dioxygenase n=1 Tax=Suricata suricatta TaxID=37032 RepID=A0A673STZ1_SURSU